MTEARSITSVMDYINSKQIMDKYTSLDGGLKGVHGCINVIIKLVCHYFVARTWNLVSETTTGMAKNAYATQIIVNAFPIVAITWGPLLPWPWTLWLKSSAAFPNHIKMTRVDPRPIKNAKIPIHAETRCSMGFSQIAPALPIR